MENKLYKSSKVFRHDLYELDSVSIVDEIKNHFNTLNKSGGVVFAYNSFKHTSQLLDHEIEETFNSFIHELKWFEKGLRFFEQFKDQLGHELSYEDIQLLKKQFPPVPTKEYKSVNGFLFSIYLAELVSYLEKNISIFKNVSTIDISRNAKNVLSLACQFEFLNKLQIRLTEFCDKIVKSGFNSSFDINKVYFANLDFNVQPDISKTPKGNKRGTKINEAMKDDILEVIKPLLNKIELKHEDGTMNVSALLTEVKSNEQFKRRWSAENPVKRDKPYADRTIRNYIEGCLKELKS